LSNQNLSQLKFRYVRTDNSEKSTRDSNLEALILPFQNTVNSLNSKQLSIVVYFTLFYVQLISFTNLRFFFLWYVYRRISVLSNIGLAEKWQKCELP